ncbi:MAG: Txe/YoeB family addiction module toxin [Opitutales bacterium]|nr:Txe/YoeB family addiction module toxin [Opitutales bacterium]
MRLEFRERAFEDLQYWVQMNPKVAKRLLRLIEETQRDPFGGAGKPEALKGELAGWWSKRIDKEHRLIYRVEGDGIIIAQAKGHYDD